MRGVLAGSLVAVAALVTGCGPVARGSESAGDAARAFYTAISDGDTETACSWLAPKARTELEDSAGKACAKALQEEEVPAAQVRRVRVYGQGAFVEADADTAFLGRFPDGWRITAAGCTQQAKQPYDCRIEIG